MIALLKYGSGLPFNRLEGLQGDLEIPLPASTQWDIVAVAATRLQPALAELIRQAAQGEVLHNDDTTSRSSSWADRERRATRPMPTSRRTGRGSSRPGSSRRATASGSRCSSAAAGTRARTWPRCSQRGAEQLPPPIQMCDALSRNLPGELQTILAHCLAHARRRFVDVYDRFPEPMPPPARIAGRGLSQRRRSRGSAGLSPEDRLQFHQEASRPTMQDLHDWLRGNWTRSRVEPNSGLGGAIGYMLKHWEKLTLFLRQAGAPLDNNVCERALKKAILHRKNALFYKTQNGARVGDLFMSLIYTCQLNEANPFDYLTAVAAARRRSRPRPGAGCPGTTATPSRPRRSTPDSPDPWASRRHGLQARYAREIRPCHARPRRSKPPDRCPICAGTALVRRITTYPVVLTAPASVRGKQIHVNRVALHQCDACGHLMPTRAGQAKVDRLVARSIRTLSRPATLIASPRPASNITQAYRKDTCLSATASRTAPDRQ